MIKCVRSVQPPRVNRVARLLAILIASGTTIPGAAADFRAGELCWFPTRGTGLLIGVLTLVLTAGCVPGHLIYSTDAYRGTVVDAETKAPLAGAAVLAIWYREAVVFGGHGPAEDYHNAFEVVTDAKGEFTIPAKTHFTLIGKILEPKFVVYYPGYEPWPGRRARPHGKDVNAAFEQRSFRFELPKLKTREERLEHATTPSYAGSVPDAKMPNLIRLVNRELKALGLPLIRGQKESD